MKRRRSRSGANVKREDVKREDVIGVEMVFTPLHPHTPTPLHPAPRRRGSAYAIVLGISLLVTVLGMGAVVAARIGNKNASNGTDWDEAGVLAYSGVEDALATLNASAAANPSGWRTAYTNNKVQFT